MKYENNKPTDIPCPKCGKMLIVKTNRNSEHQFLGCPDWPECEYTRGIPEEWKMREAGQKELF
jgi:ssDNA-binding Zn-finger/Zn-ribbon topoisomerase 1